MNRLGNLKVQSRHTIFDHARCRKKSVLQSTGGLYSQLNQLNYDTPFLLLCLLYYPLPTLLPALLLPASFPACSLHALLPTACSSACSLAFSATPCLLLCLHYALLPALRPPACFSATPCLLLCLLYAPCLLYDPSLFPCLLLCPL